MLWINNRGVLEDVLVLDPVFPEEKDVQVIWDDTVIITLVFQKRKLLMSNISSGSMNSQISDPTGHAFILLGAHSQTYFT